jgi:thiamine monophosphate synthase
MWWADLAEKLISRSAPIVAIVGVGPGNAALATAYGVGLVVCLFTLADRLDTVPGELGWVRGVPTIVRDS